MSTSASSLARVFASEMLENLRLSAARKRFCITCFTKISAARLQAKPNATQCAPCLEAAGDVPLACETASRFSEHNKDLLSELTESPILPVEIDTTCSQTNEEIIDGLNELEGADTCES